VAGDRFDVDFASLLSYFLIWRAGLENNRRVCKHGTSVVGVVFTQELKMLVAGKPGAGGGA
jgi:hypothetical protein